MNQLKPQKLRLLFNWDSANNTIWSCFFLFVLIIDLYFLILIVIRQIFNPIAELSIPIRIPTKEAKVEIETHPVIAIIFLFAVNFLIFFYF